MYTKVMELNYWSSTDVPRAPAYDDKKKEWTVVVDRDGKEIMLKPKQLVLATGMSGKPNHAAIQGHGQLQGRAAPFLAASRARMPMPARRSSSSARTIPPMTSARRFGRPAPT